MAWLTEGKKPFKKFTRAERAAWVNERRQEFAASRRAALDLQQQTAGQVDAFIAERSVIHLPVQPNSMSDTVKRAPAQNGRKGGDK